MRSHTKDYKITALWCTIGTSTVLCSCSDTPVAPGFLRHLEIRLKYSLHYTVHASYFCLAKTSGASLARPILGMEPQFLPFLSNFFPWNLNHIIEILFRRRARMSSEPTRSKRWWPSSKGPGRSIMSQCYLT